MQLTVRDMFLYNTCLCDTCLRNTRLRDTCPRDTPLCETSRLSLRDTLQLSTEYAVDTKRRAMAVPRMLQRPRVLAATAMLQNSPPDTDLVSILARTDAPLVESGHTFKRKNRSRRFRRKLSSGPQQNTKEPSINKMNGSSSSRSEEALAFKTVDYHPPSTTTVIAPQPELVMWIPANPVEDRVDGQRALWVAVPAASEEDSCFPRLSKDGLSGFPRRCLHLF